MAVEPARVPRDGSAKELVELVEEDLLLDSILAGKPEPEDAMVHIGEEDRDETFRSIGVIVCHSGVAQSPSAANTPGN